MRFNGTAEMGKGKLAYYSMRDLLQEQTSLPHLGVSGFQRWPSTCTSATGLIDFKSKSKMAAYMVTFPCLDFSRLLKCCTIIPCLTNLTLSLLQLVRCLPFYSPNND